MKKHNTLGRVIDTYIESFPPDIRKRLTAMRKTIRTNALGATEVKFPLDQPLPHDLIARVVRFRVKENFHRTTK